METSIAQEVERASCASAQLRIRKTQVYSFFKVSLFFLDFRIMVSYFVVCHFNFVFFSFSHKFKVLILPIYFLM